MIDATGVIVLELDPPKFTLIRLPVDDVTVPTKVNVNPVSAITNYQYEVKLNDEKRRIKILKPQFLTLFLTDHRNIMLYDKSSDYISDRLKSTYNPRISGV